jgi:hypothetical protein
MPFHCPACGSLIYSRRVMSFVAAVELSFRRISFSLRRNAERSMPTWPSSEFVVVRN